MNNELQQLREEFEQRIKALEDDHKEEEEWPKEGDNYWVIETFGGVKNYDWLDDVLDRIALNKNAIFKTEEEAEFEAGRLKVLRELEKMGSPYDDQFGNWCIYLDTNGNLDHYCEMGEGCFVYGDYYFRSEEEVKEAIEKIGKDRIKKYLFRVVG
ncbi:hypothetical protein ACWOBX_08230 [Facklamia languida]